MGISALKASVGDVLVFTFIGYEPIEYKLTAADTNLKVRFTDSSELLDEVVVVGYGVQKKSVLSSAVSRVTSEELDKGNPTNIQNALKGKVSGVQIISNSGSARCGIKDSYSGYRYGQQLRSALYSRRHAV
ncbi:hypothetical protein NIB75_27235 [Bacteroides uniformis]|nr:hypothetical protein [Bacteroides uniformis]